MRGYFKNYINYATKELRLNIYNIKNFETDAKRSGTITFYNLIINLITDQMWVMFG